MDRAVQQSVSNIRQIQTRRDIAGIADLIELCFAETMDSDGREYVRYLRRLSTGFGLPFLPPAVSSDSLSGIPVRGFVWEEDGAIVGNLTLIYIHRSPKMYALIANVATHPDYRRRGIARKLTLTALDAIQSRGLNEAWLHVRDDNPTAERLYLSLGFEEQFRRTQWQWEPGLRTAAPEMIEDVRVGKRIRSDWQKQVKWLARDYPPEVVWNLPLDLTRLRPNLWAAFRRIMAGEEQLSLSARYQGELIGVLSWQPSPLYSDHLWLACAEKEEPRAARALLTAITHTYRRPRPLALNYPAGKLTDVLKFCGFYPHLTLIWMRKTFHQERS